MAAYYNEFEPFAAAWLRNLIAAGHIAPGDVDERSITEVSPDDVRGYDQCHWFAGIGGWSLAARLAGIPDDRPFWSGSAPCQPFSAAGKQRGSDDERHLWPAFFNLIRECRPASVFGEQVAGAAGLAWLDHVCADLEGAGYAAAAADLPACSVGAPHRRQRLFWVAHAERGAAERRRHDVATAARGSEGAGDQRQRVRADVGHGGEPCAVDDTDGGHAGAKGIQRGRQHRQQPRDGGVAGTVADHDRAGRGECAQCDGATFSREPVETPRGNHADGRGQLHGVDHAERARLEGHGPDQAARGWFGAIGSTAAPGPFDPWRNLEWIPCTDGKARPTVAIVQCVADGLSAGMVPLRTGQEGETVDGTPSNSCAHQEVQAVLPTDAAQDVQPPHRGSRAVRAPDVLRSGVHGELAGGSDQGAVAAGGAVAGNQDDETSVRALRINPSQARPSQGREPSQQRSDEPPNIVRSLSSAGAFASLRRDDRTTDALRALRESSHEARLVLDAPDAVSEVWRSLGEEGQGRLLVALAEGGLGMAPLHPLAHGITNRAGRLRAYGNAIVPQVAAIFIQAVMEARP